MLNKQITINLNQLAEHILNLSNGIYPKYPSKYKDSMNDGKEDWSKEFSIPPFISTDKTLLINDINYQLMGINANCLDNTFIPVKLTQGLWIDNTFIGKDTPLRKTDVYAYEEDDESGHTMELDEAFQVYATKSIEMPFLPTYVAPVKDRTPLLALMEFAIAGYIIPSRYTDSLYNVVLREYGRFLYMGFLPPKGEYIYPSPLPQYDILFFNYERLGYNPINSNFMFLVDNENKRLHFMGRFNVDDFDE